MESRRSGRGQRFCSEQCRKSSEKFRARLRRNAARPPQHELVLFRCAQCARDVRKPGRGRSPSPPYCSQCRRAINRAAELKRWRARNPETARAKSRESRRKWRQSGKVRLHQSVSGQIRNALHGAKDGRSWEALVGYSRQELVAHLEKQFGPGMSWDNYGRWHIDHIQPAGGFSYSDPADAEFRACWSLSNLRPLWAAANLSKKDQRILLL